MVLGWVFMIRAEAGSYHILGWIVSYRRTDRILSAGLDCIVFYRLDHIRKHWILCASWLLAGWDRWTGWDVGGTGMGWTDVSRRRNGSATIGS